MNPYVWYPSWDKDRRKRKYVLRIISFPCVFIPFLFLLLLVFISYAHDVTGNYMLWHDIYSSLCTIFYHFWLVFSAIAVFGMFVAAIDYIVYRDNFAIFNLFLGIWYVILIWVIIVYILY